MGDWTRVRLAALAVAALCAALGAYLALSWGDETRLQQARDELRRNHPARALARLDGLGGQATGRTHVLRGYAYLGDGRPDRASKAFRLAVLRYPNNWELQRDYAIVLLKLGQRVRARARMQRALALNPRMQLPRGFRRRATRSSRTH